MRRAGQAQLVEHPTRVAQDHDFGGFSADWAAGAGTVTFTLSSHRNAVTLPRERYPELLKFWMGIRGALRSQVVLSRR